MLVQRIEANPETQLMVGFMRRFDESNQDAYKKLREGAIGRPVVMRAHSCAKLDLSPFFKHYLQASGGIFLDSTIHDIDLALFFLGDDLKPKSVSAVGVAAVYTELNEAGDADNAVGICEFWDGKFAFFYNSRISRHGYDNAAEIMGTGGKLSINMTPRKNRVELCDGDGYIKEEATPEWYDRYSEAFVTEVNVWTDALLNGKPMPIPLRSALTSLDVATALQESLRTGSKIEFTPEGLRK